MRIFYSVIIILLSKTLFSQEKVDFNDFNYEKLAYYLTEDINYIRDTLKLEILSEDKTLKEAAQFHSNYLVKTGKLSHYQQKDKYKKPSDRVATFGGKHNIIAENIAYQSFPNKKYTYQELAKKITLNWVKSPGHYKNIKDDRVNLSGFGIAINAQSQKVFVTQVFGQLNSVSQFIDQVPSNAYGIQYNSDDYDKKCTRCNYVMKRKPAEVLYGLHAIDGEVFFSINDPKYFGKFFSDKNDGIAVDIVSKDQFKCGIKNTFANSNIHRGFLLPPVYRKELLNIATQDENGYVYVKVGDVPKELINKEVEYNLLLIQDKFLCVYNPFYDIPGYKWDLLEMGVFLDSAQKVKNSTESIEITQQKKLKFEIPFKKNVSKFSQSDIQPLYDSLKLKRYDIKHIEIRAFSSIEGSTKRNIELQEQRAQSIIDAINNIQQKEIPQTVTAKENWVEFYRDIKRTKYQNFTKKDQNQIKKILKEQNIADELEPLLNKERRAVIYLTLERKSFFKYENAQQTISMFNTALSEADIQAALEIQQEVYNKISDHKAPNDLVDKLEIPKQKDYALLLNNQAIFQFKLDSSRIKSTLESLYELEKIVPNSKEVKYNICAVEIRSWTMGNPSIEPNNLLKKIERLEIYGISRKLITRLLINFNIVYSEVLMRDRLYDEKNKVLNIIYLKYKDIKLTNNDILNLAQYFASYNAYDKAIKLLTPYVMKIDVDEDLLFYYLNLTIVDKRITAQRYYRDIMLNAVNINKNRFCTLFNTFGKGGITFQLLENNYLKSSYCKYCN